MTTDATPSARLTVRDAFLAALGEDAAGYLILADARTLEGQLARPALVLQTVKVTKPPAGRGVLEATVQLWACARSVGPAELEDTLDQLLVDVLGHLDAMPFVDWTEASRIVLDDRYPAWSIPLSVVFLTT